MGGIFSPFSFHSILCGKLVHRVAEEINEQAVRAAGLDRQVEKANLVRGDSTEGVRVSCIINQPDNRVTGEARSN